MSKTDDPITVYVCTTCRPEGDPSEPRVGARFFDKLSAAVTDSSNARHIQVAPVECLSVCKRPATIAVTGADRWTYIYGDIGLDTDLDELIEGLKLIRRAENGIVPWRQRPQIMKRGLVARVPPYPGASVAPSDMGASKPAEEETKV